jgi:hypothetical protein
MFVLIPFVVIACDDLMCCKCETIANSTTTTPAVELQQLGRPRAGVVNDSMKVPFHSIEAQLSHDSKKSFLFFRVVNSCFRTAVVGPGSLCVEQLTSWLLGRRARDHVSV